MRILIQEKNNIQGGYRHSRTFAWLPKRCFDLDSQLEFIVWLEPITTVYKFINDKWVVDHYLINGNIGSSK